MLLRFNLGPAQRDAQERGREQEMSEQSFPASLIPLHFVDNGEKNIFPFMVHQPCALCPQTKPKCHVLAQRNLVLSRALLFYTDTRLHRNKLHFSFPLTAAIVVQEMKLGRLFALSGSQLLPSLQMLPTGMIPAGNHFSLEMFRAGFGRGGILPHSTAGGGFGPLEPHQVGSACR